MVDHRVKRLGQQGIGLRKANAGRNRFWQLFGEVAMQGIFRPQHLTARCRCGCQLHQCILLVIRHAQHTLARHQRPGVALTGWTRQQTLCSRLRQLAVLLCNRMQLGTIFSPLNQRVQRLGQHGFHLRIHRIFRVLTRQRHAQRIFRTVCQQAVQIERTARFRAGAGETFTAERLHAHDRANHVAVDVQVADFSIAGHLGNGFVDTGMHAKRQAVTRGVDLIDQLVEVVTVVAHHVQYRTEDLFFQLVEACQLNQRWRHEGAGLPLAGIFAVLAHRLEHRTAFGTHGLNVVFNVGFGFRVDHRPDVGGETARVAHAAFRHRTAQHLQRVVSHVIL